MVAGAMSIPLAFQERATAGLLTALAKEAWTLDARGATLEQASAYYAAFGLCRRIGNIGIDWGSA
jgi:hypothetical protein